MNQPRWLNPKKISRAAIVRHLLETPYLTRHELAEHFQVHPVVMLRHLKLLNAVGVVVRLTENGLPASNKNPWLFAVGN